MDTTQALKVLSQLTELYPEARPELHFNNPFETLISTVLSAQCTDVRVNKVTEVLFAQYPDAFALSKLSTQEIEPIIRECGLYHSKAKHIEQLCRVLVDKYGGEVPSTREELTALPGVGRKTANVVLANAFGIPAFAVDTHVFRVSNRIGLAHADDVERTEQQLTALIPDQMWNKAHHLLIWHGRRCCAARKPACERCPVTDCEYRAQLSAAAEASGD